jgi:hypothetical protein
MIKFAQVTPPAELPVEGFTKPLLYVPPVVKKHFASTALANWEEETPMDQMESRGIIIRRDQFRGSNRAGQQTMPAMQMTEVDDKGFGTTLVVYSDCSALVMRSVEPLEGEPHYEDRLYVLPVVFKLTSTVRHAGRPTLKLWALNGSSRNGGDPILRLGNPLYPGSSINLLSPRFTPHEGVTEDDRAGIHNALMTEAQAWSRLIKDMPDLGWPAALPRRGWDDLALEWSFKTFIGDLAQWLFIQSNGRFDSAVITVRTAPPRQTIGKQAMPEVQLTLRLNGEPIPTCEHTAYLHRVIEHLKSDANPLPLENLIGQQVTRGTRRSDHGQMPYKFIVASDRKAQMSNHDKLKLIKRFGTVDT